MVTSDDTTRIVRHPSIRLIRCAIGRLVVKFQPCIKGRDYEALVPFYVENILHVRNLATADRIARGILWYERMSRICKGYADTFGVSPLHIGMVYAAHSSNTAWKLNIRHVARHMKLFKSGNQDDMRGTLGNNIRKAEAAMRGELTLRRLCVNPDARKTRMFARACSGDMRVVVVDRHACRIAYGYSECDCKTRKHGCYGVPEGRHYDAIAKAYRIVAKMYDEAPSYTQAITWLVTREVDKS